MPENDTAFGPRDPLVALVLLTRLPLPRLPDAAFQRPARVVWAFPLAGLVVGGLAALAGVLALHAGLPAMVAAGLALVVQCAATGAMHEDGLADTLDGLWGGHTREARLEIMKDSTVGAYGAIALVLSLGLRWALIAALLPVAPGAVVAAACLSRAGMPVLMYALPHARDFGLSHGVGRPTARACAIGLALGLVLAFLTAGHETVTGALLGALALAWLARQARKRIGGQTGDILGASQQLGEIAILLALAAHL